MKKEAPENIMKRILKWVVEVIKFVDSLPKTTIGFSIGRQLIDSAGSVGANFVETRAARSKKEFMNCARISIKEGKESFFWLVCLQEAKIGPQQENLKLFKEGNEIVSILTAIIKKTESNIKILNS